MSSEPIATPNAAQELSTPVSKAVTTGGYHGPSSALHNAITLTHPKTPGLLAVPDMEDNTASKELFAETSKQRKYRFSPGEQNSGELTDRRSAGTHQLEVWEIEFRFH